MINERQRKRIASDRRAGFVFAALAVIAPLVLALLFGRQERRLRALADHGRPGTATLTMVTRQGSRLFSHYRYDVDGAPYTWDVDRDDAPFASGEVFAIVYLPEDPSLSRPGASYTKEQLDQELNLPFRRGVTLGLFAFFGGAAGLCYRSVARARRGVPPRTKPLLTPDGAGRIVAGMLIGCLLAVELDPKVRAVQAAAFGAAPFGVPVWLVASIVEALLFMPYFWVFPHLMRFYIPDQTSLSLSSEIGVAPATRTRPERTRSVAIVIAGLAYFVAIATAWIAFAHARGV